MSFDKKTAVSLGLTVALAVSVVTAGMIGGKIGFKSNGEQEVAQSALDSAAGKVAANELPVNVIDDKYRTTYEVFVYSFCDSDGDGIGDLKGLTSKLDYISDGDVATDTDLGCNEIWLMPVSPSPTYHKYDVTDYKDIDPEYGTLEDFDELIKACHDRGIRVIIDQMGFIGFIPIGAVIAVPVAADMVVNFLIDLIIAPPVVIAEREGEPKAQQESKDDGQPGFAVLRFPFA